MLSQRVFDLARANYQNRLVHAGIPSDPTQRTLDQQATATVLQWATINEIVIQMGSLDPTALES